MRGLVALWCLAGWFAAVQAAEPVLTIKTEAGVGGILVSVAEVVEQEGLTSEMLAALRTVFLGEAPLTVTAEQVRGRLHQSDSRWRNCRVEGGPCLVTKSDVLLESRARIQDSDGTVIRREEIVRKFIVSEWMKRVSHADWQWDLVARPPLGELGGWSKPGFTVVKVGGDFSLRSGFHGFVVEWREAGSAPITSIIGYDCQARRLALVTTRLVARGEILSKSDLQEELVAEDFSCRERPAIASLAGMVARRDIPAGTAVRENWLEKQWLVLPGAAVKMRCRKARFAVETIGKAKERGGLGDLIRVENSESRQLVLTKVIGPNEVEVAAK